MDKTFIFIIAILLLLLVSYFLMHFLLEAKSDLDQKFIQNKWEKITSLFKNGNYAMAVIESDKLLDEVLKIRGVDGETMGERLKNSEKIIDDINRAWSAHKLRNKLVHESDFQLKKNEAKRAVNDFKKSLKSLGAKI